MTDRLIGITTVLAVVAVAVVAAVSYQHSADRRHHRVYAGKVLASDADGGHRDG